MSIAEATAWTKNPRYPDRTGVRMFVSYDLCLVIAMDKPDGI